MGDLNYVHNRAVWFDVPVADLDRAQAFYAAVLGVGVSKETFGETSFCVIDHQDGNGGCLVIGPDEVSDKGVLLYLNTDGRIRDAIAQAEKQGGKILQPLHPIGPHGFRAIILDSEGNRVALHSRDDG
jgi:hypothetical protein